MNQQTTTKLILVQKSPKVRSTASSTHHVSEKQNQEQNQMEENESNKERG